MERRHIQIPKESGRVGWVGAKGKKCSNLVNLYGKAFYPPEARKKSK